MRTREPQLWKGIVAGAVAGLAASWIMTQFQTGWSKIKEQRRDQQSEESNQDQAQAEDATMKTAGAVSRTVFRKELQPEEKKKLAPAVHYGFGTLMGAVYGGLSEIVPVAKSGWGTVFGSALFLGADEIAVPLLGLGASPTESSWDVHLYAWASHAVYGVALESVRRPMRAAMGYEDLGAKVSRVQRSIEEKYDRAREFATGVRELATSKKKRVRSNLKSGLKSTEKTIRRIRKAA